MPDSRSSDERYDVSLIVATSVPLSPAAHGPEILQHVSFQHRNPLEHSYQASKLALFPGEYIKNASILRDGQHIYAVEFETSLGRNRTVGRSNWQAQQVCFTALMDHELRSLDLFTDGSARIINIHPRFHLRKRVGADYLASWLTTLDKIKVKASKREELPRKEVNQLLKATEDTIQRLAALDGRCVLSVSAPAASFDSLLHHALHDVFSRSNIIKRAVTIGGGAQRRIERFSSLSSQLESFRTQLTAQFEMTERQFLTIPFVSDGCDVVPFVLRFLTEPVTTYSCDAAVAVFTSHLKMISQFGLDYVSRLLYFFLQKGDLVRLQTVVALQAGHDNTTKAEVFKRWECYVPAIRLAIKHRHVAVLKWLLFEIRLFPEDTQPPVQLDSCSHDRFWTIDQLLTAQEHEVGANCEELNKCHQFVTRVRLARDFHTRVRELLNRDTADHNAVVSKVQALVPLMTHAFDLKWLFTFVDMYNIPEATTKALFADAFRHVLNQKLVLDLPSAIFFNKAFKNAKRQGYVTRDVVLELEVRFTRAHMEGATWASELQHQVRQTMHEMDSTNARLNILHETLQRLRQSIAQREQSDEERECRKQLLSIVTSLLPMVSPAFSILEQCVNLCDPIAVMIQIQQHDDDSEALDMGRLMSRNDPTGGVRLQDGLAEALGSIKIDADDLVQVLRDVFREDSEDEERRSRRESDEQPANDTAAARRMRFHDAVKLYMEQRRELDLVVQTSFKERHESQAEPPNLFEEELMEVQPTWKWYGMLTGVRGLFTAYPLFNSSP